MQQKQVMILFSQKPTRSQLAREQSTGLEWLLQISWFGGTLVSGDDERVGNVLGRLGSGPRLARVSHHRLARVLWLGG